MSPLEAPPELEAWVSAELTALGDPVEGRLAPLSGDASNRRYFRIAGAGTSYVVAEAPPATEKNAEFLAVRQLLAGAGVRVPGIIAADLERGYLLLEDLGDRLLLPELQVDSVERYYNQAGDLLLRMAAARPGGFGLPAYDETLLTEELARFPEWFVGSLLDFALTDDEAGCLAALWRVLLDNAAEQPRVLVHRDFHSRNLMCLADGELAVIDFQDAVIGPITYDLVSLLRDCYVSWPPDRVRAWALAHRDALQAAGHLASVGDERFLRWFDLMGLQRHIKVLGTFARLNLRDGKAAYLRDLPLVVRYVTDVVGMYAPKEAAIAAFANWFESRLAPRISEQSWSARS